MKQKRTMSLLNIFHNFQCVFMSSLLCRHKRLLKQNKQTNKDTHNWCVRWYLLQGLGLWARQPTDKHSNRTKALMLLAGPHTSVRTERHKIQRTPNYFINKLTRLEGCVHCSHGFTDKLSMSHNLQEKVVITILEVAVGHFSVCLPPPLPYLLTVFHEALSLR